MFAVPILLTYKPGCSYFCWVPGWEGLKHTWRSCRALSPLCALCPQCWRQSDGRYSRRSTLSWICGLFDTAEVPTPWSETDTWRSGPKDRKHLIYTPSWSDLLYCTTPCKFVTLYLCITWHYHICQLSQLINQCISLLWYSQCVIASMNKSLSVVLHSQNVTFYILSLFQQYPLH